MTCKGQVLSGHKNGSTQNQVRTWKWHCHRCLSGFVHAGMVSGVRGSLLQQRVYWRRKGGTDRSEEEFLFGPCRTGHSQPSAAAGSLRGTTEHQLGDGPARQHPSAYAKGSPVEGLERGGLHGLKPMLRPPSISSVTISRRSFAWWLSAHGTDERRVNVRRVAGLCGQRAAGQE